jgi:hypothetical protein
MAEHEKHNSPTLGTRQIGLRLNCLVLLWMEEQSLTNGLASILVNDSAGNGGYSNPLNNRITHRLLDRVLALALEISTGSGGRFTYSSSANGAWILYIGRTRSAQSVRANVAGGHRAYIGIYV